MAVDVQSVRSRLSRYATTNSIDLFGNSALRSTFYNEIPVTEEDSYLKVEAQYVGRLDLVSFRYYGTSRLWWVIAVATKIRDPFIDVKVGTILRIPAIQTAIQLLGV